jgi:3-oxoacyl-[acyl-carrier-protein] synthase-3
LPLRSRITGTGFYVPKKTLSNFDLEKMVDTSDEWITERTGIKQRRIADSSEAASDLSFKASKRALKSAGLSPKEIDMIIVATMSGDMPLPATASFLQYKLGAKKAAAFDLNAACTGFIYGLSILFGDAAGAVVIEPTQEKRGILSTHIHSDGRFWKLIYMPGGGSRTPASKDSIKKKQHFVKMKGNETFKIAVRTLEKIAVETLKANNLKPSELSLLIPHQANLRIIQATAKRLNLSMDRVVVNIEKYGNTSSASIPIALDEALRKGRIRNGDYVLLEAFGGGLTWGSALIKW